MKELIFGLCLGLFGLYQVNGKYSEGVLNTQSSLLKWQFLERFCFVSQKGRLKYEFVFPAAFAPQFLYLYYDSSHQWPAVYKTGKTCEEKSGVLNPDNNQIIRLGPGMGISNLFYQFGCARFQKNGQLWYNCSDERRFLSYRERWWYLAIANCNSTRGFYLEYKIWMTNSPNKEDILFHEFSADEFFILPVDVGFLLIELFTFVVAVTVALMLRARQMFHQTYKLFLASLTVETLGLLFDCIAYGDYAQNGIGLPLLRLMGGMCRASSKLTFLLLLILMAKGFTITRGRLSLVGSWKIAFFMTTYSLVYGTLFIWQARVFDPGQVLYLYDSPAGYGIMIMRIIGWFWFCYALYFTLVHYPEKRGFYFRFSVCFSVWFWMGPVMILLSNHLLANWHREKVVNGVENAIAFLGFAAFLFMTRPSAANSNFPYHVRTTQIDVMNESDETDNSVSLPHHTYALGPTNKGDDVFTVSGRKGNNDPFVRYNKGNESGGGVDASMDPLNQSVTVNGMTVDPPPAYEEAVSYEPRTIPTETPTV